ncbi:MAG: hypothetical protein WC579_01490 [Candidatus Paceibacterota bacterium]
MDVYLLKNEEIKLLQSKNKQGAHFCACDYGKGICIDIETLKQSVMAEHKKALESIKPLSEREIMHIELQKGL